jgi:hypothetical protein
MKWYKLKNSTCPKCERALKPEEQNSKITCGNPACDFSISPGRMQEIVSDQAQRFKRRDSFSAFDRSGWNRF